AVRRADYLRTFPVSVSGSQSGGTPAPCPAACRAIASRASYGAPSWAAMSRVAQRTATPAERDSSRMVGVRLLDRGPGGRRDFPANGAHILTCAPSPTFSDTRRGIRARPADTGGEGRATGMK